MTPLKCWRGDILSLSFWKFVIQKVLGVEWKGSEKFTSTNGEHLDSLRIIAIIVVGEDVVLLWREGDKVDTWGGESTELFKVFASPEDDSLVWYEGGEVATLGRPLDVVFEVFS